ncbi:MAG: carboxypeptidase-like regulatory domain-containing protein, partial [Saprospiraceae bacterium]|nr:carboxypeptidase-like regulatory domain-containing protein [Saprospiraceae bacterium]
MKSSFILFLLALLPSFSWGQSTREIEGRILNATTKEPVSYANVYNKTLQKGTITNDDGYFRVVTSNTRDSIMIIFIGYETQIVKLSSQQDFYTIYMEESTQLLREIVVTPNDNLYLFDLLVKCRSKASSFETDAK